MIKIKDKKKKNVRKGIWVDEEVFCELKKISINKKNSISFYSLTNDLLNFALKNLDYDKETGEIK